MRRIWSDKEEIGSSLFPNGNDFVTKEELTKLIVRFDNLVKDFNSLKESLDTFIEQIGETLTTKNINAINASLENILAGIIKAKELAVEGKITANELEVTTTITTDFIKSVRAVFNELDTETINAKDVSFINTVTEKLTADTVDIKNWSIENLKIETAEIDNLETKTIGTEIINTNDVQTDSIEAKTGNIDEVTSDKVVTGKLDSFEVKSSQFVWKELQEVVDQDRFYLELPHFENGAYFIKAITGSFDEGNFEGAETLFTIESRNSVNNYFISWSQDEIGYLERVYITTLENKLVYRIFNLRGKKIRILFANVSSVNVGAPNSFEDYDQQISSSYVFEYKDGNKFFRPVDLFNDGVAVGVLTLDSTDIFDLANADAVTYDTTENKRYTSYLPDQSLNTKDDVKFNSVDAPFLDIKNANITKKLRTPNIYNGPEVDPSTLNDDTFYIPNAVETEYTSWAFRIEGISEYTDNWQDACRGYDWQKTKYVGEELDYSKAEDVTEVKDYDVQHICVRNNVYYLMYGSTSTNTGNISTLAIDDNGTITYPNKAQATNQRFWAERAATNQINVANLQDYDEVWFGNALDTENYRIVYKNVQIFKGHNIPYLKTINQNGTLYRKTTEDGEAVIAEIVPINTEAKENYEENTPLTYDKEKREITNDDDIVIKNDLTVKNDVTIENKTTTKELEVLEDATVDGNLSVEGDSNLHDTKVDGTLTTTGDAKVAGDLYVTGTTHVTSQEDLVAFGDIITIRANNELPLADGQVSGIVVNNYDGENDLALVTDNEGTLRVGTGNGESTTYENVLYNDADKKWYKYTVEDDEITLGDEVSIEGSISSWENRRVDGNYTVYDSVTATVIDKTSLVPLLGREESENMDDNALLKWNGEKLIAETIPLPENDKDTLVASITEDEETGEKSISYGWGDPTGNIAQIVFDDIRPVGSTYTQYPWQKDPNELFDTERIKSVWEAIKDYDGAFFRAEGGLADEFQEEKQTGNIIKVVESPLVWLNWARREISNLQRVNYVGIPYQNVFTNTPYTTTDYESKIIYQLNDVHIVSIKDNEDDTYELTFENGVSTIVDADIEIFNYDISVGTLKDVLKRQVGSMGWTVEIHDDFSIDTTQGNVAVSTASAANPSTAQHSVRITPVIGGTQSLSTSESGVVSVLNNRSQLMYNKNVSLGHLEGLFTKWKVETGEDDNYVAYPVVTENGDVYSMTNTANPTDTQIIVSVEQAEGTTTYNVRFKDGSTANYSNTSTFYVIHTKPDGTRAATSCGQIQAIFHEWQHKVDPDDFYWQFPNTDEYCFSTSNTTTPTPAQTIDKIWGNINNSNYIEVLRADGTPYRYTYNEGSIYFVDKVAKTATRVFDTDFFKTPTDCRFTKETETKTVYLPNQEHTEDGSLVLSIASAASPSTAQQVKYIMPVDDSHWVVVKQDNTVTVYNTNGVSTTLYNKNVVWGTINAIKLGFDFYESPGTNNRYYTPKQFIRDNDNKNITQFTYEPEWGWSYVINEDGKVNKVDWNGSALSVYDENDENFAITPQILDSPCLASTETIDFYTPPMGGVWYGTSTLDQNLFNTAGTTVYEVNASTNNNEGWWNDNLARELFESDPARYPALIEKVWLMPGSTMPTIQTMAGVLSTVASVTSYIGGFSNMAGLSYAGILYTQPEYVERVNYNPMIAIPPEGCRAYRGTSNSAANRIVNIRYDLGEVRTLVKDEATGRYIWFDSNSTTSLYKYDEETNTETVVTGRPTAVYTLGLFDYDNEDIEYYYPPEVDYLGNEYIASIASNATPTDAQKVVKIDPLEGTTQYNVHFADGHQAVYANTQGIYNKNLYYTTIQGIVDNYSELKHETISVQYNISTYDNWTISNVPVKVTRYTGVVNNNANAMVTYGSTELTDPVFRNNTVYLYAEEGGAAIGGPDLGGTISWIREDDTYTVVQRDSAPEIYGTFYAEDVTSTSGAFTAVGSITANDAQSTVRETGDLIGFRASLYNSTYGRRNEVAPKNYTIRIWVRVE